jgi:cbb3-type cytochrome c oxidase subunit III
MRSLRFTIAALVIAAALAPLASCQPKSPEQSATSSATSAASATADTARAAAAVERGRHAFLSHCAMCHGNGGNGDGEEAPAIKAQGATVARLNDAETMDRLSRAQVIDVIRKGGAHTNRSKFMPAWAESLEVSTILDVADFVLTLRTSNPAIPRSTLASYLEAPPGVPADGRELFVHHCVACHGDQGKGDGPFGLRLKQFQHVQPRDLTDTAYLSRRSDQELFAVIDLGGGHFKKAVQMPAWTQSLSPAQIRSLIAYIRSISNTRTRT